MTHWISIFEQHTYLILFAVIVLELIAIPISGEFFMGYAGYLAFKGQASYPLSVLTAIAAAGTGITITFWLGRVSGYTIIKRYGRYIHLGPERYDKIAAWIERSGKKLFVFAYFIPGIRHFTGYVSGISKMPYRSFLVPAYIGAGLWGFSFITLGKALGPRWDELHKAAGKYLILVIAAFAVFLLGLLLYKLYKNQIKHYFIKFLKYVTFRFQSIQAVELFLSILALVLLSLILWTMGLAQDYLFNEFTEFNEVASYIIRANVPAAWTRAGQRLLLLQSGYMHGIVIAAAAFAIWRKRKNPWLESVLLAVSLLGAPLYRTVTVHTLSYLHSFWHPGIKLSSHFPDESALLLIVVYGMFVFLFVRHMKNAYIQTILPICAVILVLLLAAARIAFMPVLPSDIAGGYVYGALWLFLNLLLFETLRLVVHKQTI
ncbi:DedA family protein [Ectobacillus ponti]|uniref:DedA family protein n=1 Tax=Ectobacillus ponti TaxID=2961894 RepID=A0AA42BRU3_9BACI|nr:DedA family protein [Ectobacillus ponti]MCP8970706.1 DedA family protein [Ectobacillus ponti]